MAGRARALSTNPNDDKPLHSAPLTHRHAILSSIALFVGVGIVDGFFKGALHAVSAPAYWMFDLAKFVVLPAGLLLWLAKGHGVRPTDYGLGPRPQAERTALLCLLATVLLELAYSAARALAPDWNPIPAPSMTNLDLLPPPGGWRLVTGIYMSASAGIAEEIFCRGLPLVCLSRIPSVATKLGYSVVTAILFSAMHWEAGMQELIATFAFGVVAAVLYLRTRDLWPLVVGHTIVDLVVFL